MNVKNIALIAIFSVVSINLYAMQRNLELELLSKKITLQQYLYYIEHGYYGDMLANQLHLIASINYDQNQTNKNIKNLYQILVNTLKFAIKNGHNPDQLRDLVRKQIWLRYEELQSYIDKDLVEFPSVSGE
ncbi:MAG TPA: hypothetical protein VHZ50_06605 [Puia sp.]|jgi:hypothetical protein|nr:hypothetical protein [Puia sp.]